MDQCYSRCFQLEDSHGDRMCGSDSRILKVAIIKKPRSTRAHSSISALINTNVYMLMKEWDGVVKVVQQE